MRSYEISSPSAAQLYFDRSIVGHLATLIAEALGKRGPGKPAPRTASATAHHPLAKRPTWLDRLDGWFWRQEQKEREAYLARSKDIFDLERRIRALERGDIARYY